MEPRRAALFDLDGVIIDTETLYTEFWAEIGLRYNLPSPTFAFDIKGSTLKEILERYFKDDATRQQVKNDIHAFEDNMRYCIFDGVIEFLTALRQSGFKTAIVTSSDSAKMNFLWQQQPKLADYFDVIINGSMVENSKPHPEGYLKAAKECGCNIKDCYVFEDSLQGLEAGRRSGAKVIALSTTNSADKLIGKADVIIPSFKGFYVADLP